jgi:hypothetical protein
MVVGAVRAAAGRMRFKFVLLITASLGAYKV